MVVRKEWLSRLQDVLFERLPDEESSQFAVDFLQAIPVGANLEPVKWKFCALLLKECLDNVTSMQDISHDLKTQVLSAIKGVIDVHEAAIRTGEWDEVKAREVRAAATEATGWSKGAAAWAAAASAAAESWAVAGAVVRAIRTAELAAREAKAAGAVRVAAAAACKRYAAELIRLLENGCN